MTRRLEIHCRDDYPDMAAMADAAVEAFALPGPGLVCRHIFQGVSHMGALCAQHPRVGLQCPNCQVRHIDRHDPEEEHRCDRCGERSYTMVAFCIEYVGHGFPVRDLRGRRVELTGTVLVGGLGLCPTCAESPARAAAS